MLSYRRVYRKYISIAQLHLLTTHLLAGSIPFARHCLPHQKVGLGDSKNCSGGIHRQCHCHVLSSVILFEPWHQQWFLQHTSIYLPLSIAIYLPTYLPTYLPNLSIYAGWNLEFQPPQGIWPTSSHSWREGSALGALEPRAKPRLPAARGSAGGAFPCWAPPRWA